MPKNSSKLISYILFVIFIGVVGVSALSYTGNESVLGLADGFLMPKQNVKNNNRHVPESKNTRKVPAQTSVDVRMAEDQSPDISQLADPCVDGINEEEIVFGKVSRIVYYLPVDSNSRYYSEDAEYNDPYEPGRSDNITCEIWVKPRLCSFFRQIVVTPSPFEAIESLSETQRNSRMEKMCETAEKAMTSGVKFLAHTRNGTSIRPRRFIGTPLRDVQVLVSASLVDPSLDLNNQEIVRMIKRY